MEENASSPLKREMIKTPLVGTGLNCKYRLVNPYPLPFPQGERRLILDIYDIIC